MPLYWGDYFRDTRGLSAEEHGVYLLLIAAYWSRGKPLPDDDAALAQMSNIPRGRWQHFRHRIMMVYFILTDGTFRHERIEKELLRSSARSAAGVRANSVRWSGSPPKSLPPHPHPHPQREQATQQEAATGQSYAAQAVALADELAAIAGVSTTTQPGFAAASEIITWLESGCDPETDIKPAVADVTSRLKAGGRQAPRGWAYFRNSVRQRRDDRLQGLPAAEPRGHYQKPGNGMIAAAEARVLWKPPEQLSPEEELKHHQDVMQKLKDKASAMQPPKDSGET